MFVTVMSPIIRVVLDIFGVIYFCYVQQSAQKLHCKFAFFERPSKDAILFNPVMKVAKNL